MSVLEDAFGEATMSTITTVRPRPSIPFASSGVIAYAARNRCGEKHFGGVFARQLDAIGDFELDADALTIEPPTAARTAAPIKAPENLLLVRRAAPTARAVKPIGMTRVAPRLRQM
jgi:hypothetical protein